MKKMENTEIEDAIRNVRTCLRLLDTQIEIFEQMNSRTCATVEYTYLAEGSKIVCFEYDDFTINCEMFIKGTGNIHEQFVSFSIDADAFFVLYEMLLKIIVVWANNC